MKSTKMYFIILLFLTTCVDVSAIQREFRFSKVDFNYRTISAQDTTVVGFDKFKLQNLGKVEGWGMIESLYESKPKWADDVEIRYYALMKGTQKKNPIMLTGGVTYVHVQEGREHLSIIYIPPQAIARYGGVSKVRAELWYNGVLQDSVEWPRGKSKIPWWTRIKPQSGSLFNRFYTPFAHEAQLAEEVIKTE